MKSFTKIISWIIGFIVLIVLINFIKAMREHTRQPTTSSLSVPQLVAEAFEKDAPLSILHRGESRQIVFDGTRVYGPFRLASEYGISIEFTAPAERTVQVYLSRTPNNPYWVTSESWGIRYKPDTFTYPFCFFGQNGAVLNITVR